jgi:hypothetical protein
LSSYLGTSFNSEEEPSAGYVLPEDFIDEDNPSIKVKFGIKAEGKMGVASTFNMLSYYIKGGGLSLDSNVIHLGDWIDLEGGLSVEAYNGFGNFTAEDIAITPSSLPFANYEGKLLRLIVVGINSFNGKNGNNTPHVVFQFQNLPVSAG